MTLNTGDPSSAIIKRPDPGFKPNDGTLRNLFSPADSCALGLFGATVLRRTANSFKDWTNPSDIEQFPDLELWQTYTRKPAHYGFHATIKAPFELAPDCTAAELLEELASFTATQQAIPLNGIAPVKLQTFRALALAEQPAQLVEFASEVVQHFEPYRQELSAADIARRQVDRLTTSQADNLMQYGYPFIFSDFNFHMTLSDSLPGDEDRFLPWLTTLFRQMVPQTPLLDRLSVFRQLDRSTPFVRVAEYLLQK